MKSPHSWIQAGARSRRAGLRIAAVLAFVCACVWASPAHAQHAGDVWIGHTSEGQLKVGGFDTLHHATTLPAVNGVLHGWAGNNPGFDHILIPDMTNDLYPLESGCQIRAVILAIDPAFRVIDPSLMIYQFPGDTMTLGGSTLHIHPTWHINSQSPQFDPNDYLWNITWKLIDTGSTGYTESDPFTMHFMNISCTRGDTDGDGSLSPADIAAFVSLLLDPSDTTNLDRCRADMNWDQLIDGDDVQEFLDLVL